MVCGQTDDFERYSREMKKADVTLTAPEAFKSIDLKGRQHIFYNVNPNWSGSIPTSLIAGAVLDNDDEDVAFIYPTVLFDTGSLKYSKDIEKELRENMEDWEADVTPMLKVIAKEDMSAYANADTAVIYEYKFKRPYLDAYHECVGVYLRKYGHPALLMRIALGRQASEKKDKYIRMLLDNIAYGDTPEESILAAEMRNTDKELAFPSKHRSFTGILPDIDDETLAEINRVNEWCKSHGVKKLPYIDDETLEALNHSRNFEPGQGEPMKMMQDAEKSTDAYAMLDKSIYNMATVDRQPFYYGGMETMLKWLSDNIEYPESELENGTEGKVVVEFIIDENGNVTQPNILKGLTIALNKEALRVVEAMPDWRPGKVNGEPVKTYYTLPITFSLPQ